MWQRQEQSSHSKFCCWVYIFSCPQKDDHSLMAQFYYADEELNLVAAELDSFDGRKDPERCTALVNQLRHCQDRVSQLEIFISMWRTLLRLVWFLVFIYLKLLLFDRVLALTFLYYMWSDSFVSLVVLKSQRSFTSIFLIFFKIAEIIWCFVIFEQIITHFLY